MDRRLPIASTARPGGRYGVTRRTSSDGACPRGYPCVHRGIDLPAPQGSFVTSPADATVTEVEVANAPPWTGYAPVVMLRSDDGWLHLLAHVSGLVVPGQRVRVGQPVAVVGALRHVHWEVRSRRTASDLADIVTDPRDWLDGYAGRNGERVVIRASGHDGVEPVTGGGIGWLAILALALSKRL